MYAIVQAGAHQHKVAEGDTLLIDKVAGNVGDKISLDQVVMLGDKEPKFGAPFVDGAKIEATITAQTRADKVLVFKFKRRKNYKKMNGHKQPYTEIKIDGIKH